jgi:hypothetical protein
VRLSRLSLMYHREGVTVAPPKNAFPNSSIKLALAGVPKPFTTERWDVVGVPAAGEEEKVKAPRAHFAVTLPHGVGWNMVWQSVGVDLNGQPPARLPSGSSHASVVRSAPLRSAMDSTTMSGR